VHDEPLRWPEVLTHLLHGHDLDEDRAAAVMGALMRGEAESAQVAGFLVALRAKGESPAEIAGFVRAMLDEAEPITLAPAVADRLVDTCGTGGDGAGTFNISTVAAVVTAAAGQPVAKHGNRAASSACGSADLLEAWGVAIELPAPAVARCIDELGIGFLYARSFHPAMRTSRPGPWSARDPDRVQRARPAVEPCRGAAPGRRGGRPAAGPGHGRGARPAREAPRAGLPR
jgi:anthranilate phosphoribosyltransferase